MSRFDRVPDVPVAIGPCLCPGEPQDDGDVVYLAPVLSAPAGMAVQGAIIEAAGDSIRLQEMLWRVYRDHGIVSWNLLDENGPVPLTPDNVDAALPYGKGGRLVAEKADDLYAQDVLAPFLERQERLERSRDGLNRASRRATSATRTSTRKRPPRSSTPATAKEPPIE
jgi:hypothetical protein